MNRWVFSTTACNRYSTYKGCFIRVYDAGTGKLLLDFPINARNGLKYLKSLTRPHQSKKLSAFLEKCKQAGVPEEAVQAAIGQARRCIVDEKGNVVR